MHRKEYRYRYLGRLLYLYSRNTGRCHNADASTVKLTLFSTDILRNVVQIAQHLCKEVALILPQWKRIGENAKPL